MNFTKICGDVVQDWMRNHELFTDSQNAHNGSKMSFDMNDGKSPGD
jgi:hypothetical protein